MEIISRVPVFLLIEIAQIRFMNQRIKEFLSLIW